MTERSYEGYVKYPHSLGSVSRPRKQQIHPANIEVKWGLGWIPSLRLPIRLWHVVVQGHTKATFESRDDAWKWVYERYEIATNDGTKS